MELVNYVVGLEERFNMYQARELMVKYWHWSIYISTLYVGSIFALQHWMKRRKAYDLRGPLFAWSLSLALFSAYGFYVAGVKHVTYLYDEGWKSSVCDPIIMYNRHGLWAFLFVISKLPELFDTYFIVLRKKKLIFLHWYHHITVFVYCWFHYADMINPAQWFITMNYFVHAIMYLFYAVRASGAFIPPRGVNMLITALQLMQMVVGVYVNVFITRNMSDSSWHCDDKVETTYFYVTISFVMYFSYLVLFVQFFYTNYLASRKTMKAAEKTVMQHSSSVPVAKSTESPVKNGTCHAGSETAIPNGLRHRL